MAVRRPKFDPRELMEQTIDVMRRSIHERRTDDHANMDALSLDTRKAQRLLKKLVDVGLLRQAGAGPATRFEVIRG